MTADKKDSDDGQQSMNLDQITSVLGTIASTLASLDKMLPPSTGGVGVSVSVPNAPSLRRGVGRPAAPKVPVEDRIRDLLMTSPWETRDLAKELKMKEPEVRDKLDIMLEEDKVRVATGFDEKLTWVWKLGPDAPKDQRRALLRELMKLRFMGQRELKAAIGMDRTVEEAKVIDGDVTDIRRHAEKRILGVTIRGNDRIYLIPPDDVELSWLETPIEMNRRKKLEEANALHEAGVSRGTSADGSPAPKRRGRPPKVR